MEASMTDKVPVYWPAVDIAALTSDEWQALKERVIREAGAERARAAEALLHRLVALCRRSPVSLSPTRTAGIAAPLKLR
jgi:hypothetical protein